MIDSHPNKAPFAGILAIVDEPSDKSPSGARGHKVILTKKAVEDAIPTLIGMGVNASPTWDGHDAKAKIGIIDHAEVIGNQLYVRGYLFRRDSQSVIKKLQASAQEWGMSYEVADAHVEDMRAAVYKITGCTFTGASILLREKAAYEKTRFYFL